MGCTVCFSNVVVLQLKIEKIIINGILNCSMPFFSIGTLRADVCKYRPEGGKIKF